MKIVQQKICLLGHFAVGKTSLTRRYVEDRFDEEYLGTIGIHLSNKVVSYGDVQVALYIWDLAGGEKFNLVGPHYLLGAVGALIVCDLTNRVTFEKMVSYADQLKAVNENARFVFVGNKMDLTDQKVVSIDEIQEVSHAYGGRVMLTSAKTGENVSDAFLELVKQLNI